MWSKRNMLLGGLAEAALIAAATFFFIWPRYTQAMTVRRQTQTLETKLLRLDAEQRAVQKLSEQVAAAQQRVEEEFKMVPTSADVADLIRRLSYEIDGVTVFDQTFTAGSPAEAVVGEKPGANGSLAMSMPVTADLQATFKSIFDLMREAESMKRLIRVASVRIGCKRDDKTPDTPILNASIGLEAIYEPPAAKEGS